MLQMEIGLVIISGCFIFVLLTYFLSYMLSRYLADGGCSYVRDWLWLTGFLLSTTFYSNIFMIDYICFID